MFLNLILNTKKMKTNTEIFARNFLEVMTILIQAAKEVPIQTRMVQVKMKKLKLQRLKKL